MANTTLPRGIPIEAWTQETIDNLSTLRISAATAARPASSARRAHPYAPRGTSVSLDIPLDSDAVRRPDVSDDAEQAARNAAYARRREPLRRDSLKRREALLKGKEGSRRRQRWENDRLLGNPHVTPPEPHDWAPQPTHPVHAVPYFLAPLWDERKAQAAYACAERQRIATAQNSDTRRVPRELRERLKKSRAARGLLQQLEEQVREFVAAWAAREAGLDSSEEEWLDAGEAAEGEEESDDEIVFVGRNGSMAERAGAAAGQKAAAAEAESLERDKLVFDGLVDDNGARFGRWLVHSIAAYYNLRTWSVTTGNPARREAYVGIPHGDETLQLGCRGSAEAPSLPSQLPRPLWVML